MADNIPNMEQWSKELVDLFKDFTSTVGEYLEENGSTPTQQKITDYIKGGGSVIPFEIKGDCEGALKARLTEAGIPFISTADENLITVCVKDLDKVNELNRDANMELSNYSNTVPLSKGEEAIAKSGHIAKKDILTIQGLDKYVFEALKNKCDKISPGAMLMINPSVKGADLIDVSIRADMVSTDKKMDFCKAYLSANINIYGSNGAERKAQIDKEEEVDDYLDNLMKNDMENLLNNGEPVYIVNANADKRRTYIIIDEFGAAFRNSYQKNGTWHNTTSKDMKKEDPNFRTELRKCLNKIHSKAIITNVEEMGEFLQAGKAEGAPVYTKKHAKIGNAEKKIADRIDKMIDSKFEKEGTSFKSDKDFFEHYCFEAKNILADLSQGKTTPGYDENDFAKIYKAAEKGGVDLEKYNDVAEKLFEPDIAVHEAKKQKSEYERNNDERDGDK